MSFRQLLGVVVSLCAATIATQALGAERISLEADYGVGDRYELALELDVAKRAESQGTEGDTTEDGTRYAYAASVEVMAVDEAGRVVRERHEGVELDVTVPSGHGVLIEGRPDLEIHRDPRGALRIYAHGYRLTPRVERILAEILDAQLEYANRTSWLDPGREVEVGQRWTLDRDRVSAFLETWGVRAVRFGADATARLETRSDPAGGDARRVVRFEIPIARFDPVTGLPPNTNASRSRGRLAGEVELGRDRAGATSARMELELEMRGLHSPREIMARGVAWQVRSRASFDQRLTLTHLAGSPLARAEVPAARAR